MKAKTELPNGEQPLWSRMTEELCNKIFKGNQAKGFWDMGIKNRNMGEMIALMHSELSECLENFRKGAKPDDHLPQYPGWQVELADTIIRIFDLCGAWNVPIGEIIIQKLVYNQSRPFKHGKQF